MIKKILKQRSKGQAAVTDALIFMLICSGAATLLTYVAGLYGTSTNTQMLTIYNYDFAGTALVSMHYAEDDNDDRFWLKLKEKLTDVTSLNHDPVLDYLQGPAYTNVLEKLEQSSPTPNTYLCFEKQGTSINFCYSPAGAVETRYGFTHAVDTKDNDEDKWSVVLKLYY
jgi:hypothetical protein